MELLAGDTLSKILSLTSPIDASRFAVISKGFKSAADSDSVWDGFLLPDLPEILSRSVSPVTYATKKELYVTLVLFPILLDAGRLSFSLEKKSGKKCYMVGARELWMPWADETPQYWDWIEDYPDSRFKEVAHLKSVCWLEIHGWISTRLLSWKTAYGAYLVFKLDEVFSGLDSAKALLRFAGNGVLRDAGEVSESDYSNININIEEGGPLRIGDKPREETLVHLQPPTDTAQRGKAPVRRDDGWMEVELGSFWNERGEDGDVGIRLMGIEGIYWKAGLNLQGIEFRPMH